MNSQVEELFKLCETGALDKIKGLNNSYFYYTSRNIPYANYSREDGNTPFHVAIIAGHLDIVKFLFEEKGADLICRDKMGRGSGYIASMYEEHDILRYLVEKGYPINQKSNDYWTNPLHYCIQYKSVKTLKLLLDLGADPSVKTTADSDALGYAIFESRLEMVQELLERGMDKNRKDDNDNTPFINATGNRARPIEALGIVKLLANKGADLFERGNKSRTAMHYIGSPEIGAFLLEKGFTVNVKDEEGNTPLYNFLSNFHPKLDIIKFYIFNGAEINTQGEVGHTALHFAAMFEDLELLNFLLDKKADANLQESETGKNPLHLATVYRKFEAMDGLLKYGLNIESRGSDGSTALQWACATFETGEFAFSRIKWLLDKGADINTQDNKGKGCLHWGVLNHLPEKDQDTRELISLLIKSNIDMDLKDQDGYTALEMARSQGKVGLVSILQKE